MVAVIPVDHPLCSKPSIALRDLRDEPFILFKPGYTLRLMVLDACMAAGFVPKIALEAEETDTIRAFVRAGFGVSVLPPAAMSGSLDGLCECRVTDGPVQRTVGLTWLASGSLSAAGQRFAQFAAARGRQDPR
jgi:LysR family transcriptional activator of glutamate synthase operon